MTATLGNKSVLITGSDRGIGKAIALAFANAGARVAVHGLATPGEAEAVVREMYDAQRTSPIADITTDVWNDIIAVNLSAPFQTMRCALPWMAQAGYGRVINIASVHGLVASINKSPYVAAKFGLVGLSRAAALEYAALGSAESGGITVNCICPGWVDTAIIAPQIAERSKLLGVSSQEALEGMVAEKQPSRRLSSAAEIARLACWLCAPEAHNITGTAIPIDGGWTAQ